MSRRPTILVIDDDSGTCEIVQLALQRVGLRVEAAGSGREGIAAAGSGSVDLALIDFRLPDMTGTDVAKVIRRGVETDFILISAFLTTPVTVEAMKLGAVTVLEKPLDVDDLVSAIWTHFERSHADATAPNEIAGDRIHQTSPRSAAERWAFLVLKARDSDADLRTLDQWARFAGLSYTSLCEACRLVRLRPHDARDFARMFRAVTLSKQHNCPLESFLDVSDRRTLVSLLVRAGMHPGTTVSTLTANEFLGLQTFVPSDNAGLRFLRHALRRSGH